MTNFLSVLDTEAASESGDWLHIENPATGDPMYWENPPKGAKLDTEGRAPVRIKLKGPDSDTWQSFTRKAMKEMSKANAKGSGIYDRSGDEIRREDSQLYAKMSLDWENIPSDDGQEILPFTRDNAIAFFMKYKDARHQAGEK
ncbi:MAG TPA: hypothetical protein VIC08_10950, partial [Cellvibrionaceae bacterium]